MEGTPGQSAFAGTEARRALATAAAEDARRRRALVLARDFASRLVSEFGATAVVLFGSALFAERFTERSDIDLAVRGLSLDRFWSAYAVAMDSEIPIDLVDLDHGELRADVLGRITAEGCLLCAEDGGGPGCGFGDALARRRAAPARQVDAARHDLEMVRHLADQLPEFVACARRDHDAGSNVGLFASVKLLDDLCTAVEALLQRTEALFAATPRPAQRERDLLWEAAGALSDLRPQVLQPATAQAWDALLRFRHFGRHGSYREQIMLDRVVELASTVAPAVASLVADLAAFWRHVEAGIAAIRAAEDRDSG